MPGDNEPAKPGVLMLCPFYPPNIGGVEAHLGSLVKYLDRSGFPTQVLSYKPITTRVEAYKRREAYGSVNIRRIWWFGHNWFEKTAPYPVLQFLYIVPGLLAYTLYYMARHGRQIDVIHAHGFAAGFVARITTMLFKRRALLTTHFIYGFERRKLAGRIMKWTLAPFAGLFVVSEESRRDLIEADVDPDRIKLYRHWIDQDLFTALDKEEARNSLGLPMTGKIVLFVGRLIEMKGVRELLEAARSFDDETHFVLVGDGPLANEVETAARERANILFPGKRNAEELARWYSAADMVVIPSQAKECSPVTLAEALSCGTPVIATNKGGITENLAKNIAVFLEPTATNLARAIGGLIDQPEKLARMSRESCLWARQNFGRDNAAVICDAYIRTEEPIRSKAGRLAAQ